MTRPPGRRARRPAGAGSRSPDPSTVPAGAGQEPDTAAAGGPRDGRAGRTVVRETASERLTRMLALVPYVSRRPGVRVEELAAEFGVTARQITADLDLLMVCGLPGYYPDDLIDVVLDDDGGTVSIAFDAGIERPVRLTGDEAIALTVALRALADLPGLVDDDAVRSALAKLEQHTGREAAAAQATPVVQVAAADPAPALGVVRDALRLGRRLWMRYYTASRDEMTERTVDPLRVLVTDGRSYLEAYCHLVGSIRHFRIDRIEDARVLLDEPAQPTLWADSDVPDKVFHPGPRSASVTLRLAHAARWVPEYYPVDAIEELPDSTGTGGAVRVRLQATGEAWLTRLVLSLGGDAVVEAPADLAAVVAERAAAALALYGESDGD